MENFDHVYDNLTSVYSEIEKIMGEVYEDIQLNHNERDILMLQKLGSVALKTLSTQKDLIQRYGDKELSYSLLSNIDSKAMSLSRALDQNNDLKNELSSRFR